MIYANSTPSRNLLTSISAESSGGLWTVNTSGQLQLTRTANTSANNGAGLARCADFSPTAPGVLCVRFDLGVKLTANSPTLGKAMCIEVGNIDASGDHNVNASDATIFSRLNIGLHLSSFNFYMYPTQSPWVPADGTLHRITYLMNKSGAPHVYRAPDGSLQSLQNGRMALWRNDVPLFTNSSCINAAGSDLSNIRISFPSGDKATWTFDNFVITNGQVPDLYTLPAERLAETRGILLSGTTHPRHGQLRPAYLKLIAEANLAAPAPPAIAPAPPTVLDTVVQSGLTGSVSRDYFSIGTYWTRDPNNEAAPWVNTPNDDHPENAFLTDEAAMRTVCSDASTLCLAAYLTTDSAAASRYTQRAVDLVRAWFLDDETGMHPHLNYGACVPNDPVRVGREAGIIDTVKLITLSDSLALIAGSPIWTKEDHLAWQDWLAAYVDWLVNSDLGKAEGLVTNNHSTWYDAQVAQFAMIVGDWDLAREVTRDAREKRLYLQTWSSGKQPYELVRSNSLPYSAFNLRGMLTLAQQAEWHNVDWWSYVTTQNNRSLLKTIVFLAPYAVAGSNWAIADYDSPASQWGDRLTTRELLAIAANFYPDPLFESLLPDATSTLRDYLTPFATGGFTYTYDGSTQNRLYAEERWKLFAPAP